MNDAIRKGADAGLGMGETLGRTILEGAFSHKEISVLAAGVRVKVSIRPEDLSEQRPPSDSGAMPLNVFQGSLVFAIFAGVAVEAEVRCGETSLACLLNREADLTPGRAVTLRARADACLVLPEE